MGEVINIKKNKEDKEKKKREDAIKAIKKKADKFQW